MKLFTKWQIDGALKTHHLYESLGYPPNASFDAILKVGGIAGCTITVDDAKVAYKIWGLSVPRFKDSIFSDTGPHKLQSLVKSLGRYFSSSRRFALSLLSSLSMDIYSLWRSAGRSPPPWSLTSPITRWLRFGPQCTRYTRCICFAGSQIIEIAGDGEFAWIVNQVASLLTNPILNLAAALENVGLIECNIPFLKEKTCLICHSLPFERIPALMLIHMVLHTVLFMNIFSWKGGLNHYPLSANMTGAQLHMSQLQLKFGSYCLVSEDVSPHNSRAACTRGATSIGPSVNLSEGQCFLAWILAIWLSGIAGKNSPCIWMLSTMSMCFVVPNVLC